MTRPPIVAGAVLVTLGVVLLFGELGAFDAGHLIATWWPLAVIAAGVVRFTVQPRSAVTGSVLVAVGGVLLLWRLEVVDDLGLVWPLLLLAVGGWLLIGRASHRRVPVVIGTTRESIDVVTVFGDRHVQVAPGAFGGGSVVTIFGDVDLDLTAAEPTERVRLEGVTVFGDVDLFVPADWEVTPSGPTIFGDVRIDPRSPSDDGRGAPELVLALVTVFGDLRVRRVPVAARRPETAEP